MYRRNRKRKEERLTQAGNGNYLNNYSRLETSVVRKAKKGNLQLNRALDSQCVKKNIQYSSKEYWS